jgi:hypothetical protein
MLNSGNMSPVVVRIEAGRPLIKDKLLVDLDYGECTVTTISDGGPA